MQQVMPNVCRSESDVRRYNNVQTTCLPAVMTYEDAYFFHQRTYLLTEAQSVSKKIKRTSIYDKRIYKSKT